MGRRGPAPTSDAILKLRDSNRAGRRSASATPQLPVKIPTAPSWLDADAKREFGRVGKLLFEAGVITVLDRGVLAMYAQAWSDVARLTVEIREKGSTITTKTKNGVTVRRHPAMSVLNQAYGRLNSSSQRLGLSPVDSDRVKASPPPQEPASDKDRFFKRRSTTTHR